LGGRFLPRTTLPRRGGRSGPFPPPPPGRAASRSDQRAPTPRPAASDFTDFLDRLDRIISELEFNHYDRAGQGTISARDLALTVVSNGDPSVVQAALRRFEVIPEELAKERVTLQDFLQVGEVCRQHQRLTSAMKFYSTLRVVHGKFDVHRFGKAIRKLTGVELREPILKLLFFVLDVDGSGDLDWSEVQDIMLSKTTGSSGGGDASATMVECMRGCLRKVRA